MQFPSYKFCQFSIILQIQEFSNATNQWNVSNWLSKLLHLTRNTCHRITELSAPKKKYIYIYIHIIFYYTFKVWSWIVYDWKRLEAITNHRIEKGWVRARGWRRRETPAWRGDTSWGFGRENCQQSSDCITVPRGKVHRPLGNLQASSNRSCSSASHPLHTKCFLPVLRFHFIFCLFV